MRIVAVLFPATVGGTFHVKKRIGSYPRVHVEGGGRDMVSQAGGVLLVETAVREHVANTAGSRLPGLDVSAQSTGTAPAGPRRARSTRSWPRTPGDGCNKGGVVEPTTGLAPLARIGIAAEQQGRSGSPVCWSCAPGGRRMRPWCLPHAQACLVRRSLGARIGS